MTIRKGFSFDDLLLSPQYSSLESRHEVQILSLVAGLRLEIPIISSPMDTVTESNMALGIYEMGGLGIIHRYMDINKQFSEVKWVKEMGARVGAAVGVNGDSWERAQVLIEDAGTDLIVLDVAHGDNLKALTFADKLKKSYPNQKLCSPNIATIEAAANWEIADAYRVGIGPGSSCTTRIVAGVGIPQLTAIMDIYCYAKEYGKSVIADGGIRTSGDAVKALAAGADAVMLGGLLAPFDMAAGKRYYIQSEEDSDINQIFGGTKVKKTTTMKEFRGMASDKALATRKKNYVVEGESFMVPVRYDFKEFISQFRNGIQTGFAYLGAKNIDQLREVAEFIEISPATKLEGTSHFGSGVE